MGRSCQRPLRCDLHCPFGYQTGVLGICLCICHDDPRLLKAYALSEYCRHNSGGIAFCVSRTAAIKASECPRLFNDAGACTHQCNNDSECGSTSKCCNNGCGRECVIALSSQVVVNSLSIHLFQTTEYFNRIGKCPLKNYVKNQNCVVECIYDEECPLVGKCCDNDCGRVCAPSDKATGSQLPHLNFADCIQLTSAVSRLLGKTLMKKYVPKCTVDGEFENIQCDHSYCWCVDEKGIEIIGTKTFRKIGSPNCLQKRDCEAKLCPKVCPFGIKTDHEGCPVDNCNCRDLCEELKCISDIDMCQMIDPDCAKPPCRPIGFNGLGFCCSLLEAVLHNGSCVQILSQSCRSSESECRVDSDCSEQAKCCFDRCGLKCLLDSTHNHGEKVQRIVECPQVQQHHDLGKCPVECKIDQDYPACLHEVTTHEIYGCGRVPKCNDEGNYEQIQCEDDICYCVDTVNGIETPATRTALHTEPKDGLTASRSDVRKFVAMF
uniref:Thyroglobulin type-1 domain-containing protein n=1 Tax=Loa loa TaxID=7209 RepID=A0A1I7VYU4_LOALO